MRKLAAGASAAGPAAASATSITAPARNTWRLARGSPSTATRPSSIARWAAVRDPTWPARKTSRRSPAASPGTSIRMARRPLQDVEQAEHAERDRHVGDVEGGPQRQVDEVGDEPVA